MQRFLPWIFLLALIAPPAFADENTYVFILVAKGNAYWTAMADGIEDTARGKGVHDVIYFTDSSIGTEQQLNICETAIQTQPKAIIMGAINPSIAVQCFKNAAAHGIAVADVDGSFSVTMAKKAGVPLAFSVGSDNYAIGQEAADYAVQIAGKSAPRIFILEGTVGSTQARKRANGFRNRLKELLPRAKIVASITADFDRLKAMNTTLDILQRTPDLDIIYAANDTMALGAAEAARNLGRDKDLKIIGVDGTADARKAIKEGRMTASVAQLPYLMGMRSVELITDTGANRTTGHSETTATPVLTKEMLETNTDPMLRYVR